MVAKILKHSYLIIIAGFVFLYLGCEAAGYFCFIIGGACFLIYKGTRQRQQDQEHTEMPLHRKHTITNWWWLNNHN